MSKKKDKNNFNTKTSDSTTRVMLLTLLSTTLRIFIPVLVLLIFGLIIDLNFSTKPSGIIIGTGTGIILAAILVVLQLKNIRTESNLINKEEKNGSKH